MLEKTTAGRPDGWEHAEEWSARMRRWARGSDRLVLLSDTSEERVERNIAPERCVVVPNGFDPEPFDLREVEPQAVWRQWLVDDPQGWRPGEEAGSVGYDVADLAPFADANPVLDLVGLYTAVKRIGLPCARTRERFERPAPLVLLGGYPGEWEGEHPVEANRPLRPGAGGLRRRLARRRRRTGRRARGPRQRSAGATPVGRGAPHGGARPLLMAARCR